MIACALALATPSYAEPMSGQAKFADADSGTINGVRFRMQGYDAPEWDQICHRGAPLRPYRCGLEAASALRAFIAGRPLDCDPVTQEDGGTTDRHGRTLLRCRVGGQDIGAWLVERGYVVAYLRYSDDYLPHQQRAQAAGLGLWSGVFMEPQHWRLSKRWWY